MLDQLFEIAGGSVIGKDHVFCRKPNQDAYRFATRQDLLVGVVCDGCGDVESPYSQVGAELVSRLLVTNLINTITVNPGVLEAYRRETLMSLSVIAEELRGNLSHQSQAVFQQPKFHHIVRDYLLCTAIGFAITPDMSYFFSIGDGIIYVNGKEIQIGPFPNNEPPYMAYDLLETSLLKTDPGCLKFQQREQIPTEQLESWLIGCDGVGELRNSATRLIPNGASYVGDIAQFWTDDKYFKNKEAINRRLALINTDYHKINREGARCIEEVTMQVNPGLLHDDVTIITGRRARGE